MFVCSKLVEETFARIDALCQTDVEICEIVKKVPKILINRFLAGNLSKLFIVATFKNIIKDKPSTARILNSCPLTC